MVLKTDSCRGIAEKVRVVYMAKSLRIPFLVDIITVDSFDEIRALNFNTAVDRSFRVKGPLINRIIQARFRQHTRASTGVLPAFLAREEDDRPYARETLTSRLNAISSETIANDSSIPSLAGFVRGDTSASPGPDAQALICRLFNSEIEADMRTWQAASRRRRNPNLLLRTSVDGRSHHCRICHNP